MLRDIRDLSISINTARAGHFDTYYYGNLGMINAGHNNDYPLLLLLPPTSSFNSVYKNDETVTCVFHCYQPMPTPETAVIGVNALAFSIENSHDELLSRLKKTLETLSLNNEYQYILTGSWQVERIQEEFNDGLVGIVVTCSINKFTHCLAQVQ
tara:strand:+ start:16085 stop:16546 length:462 start_codon:yes stop_codon:yes gene_type:complete